MSITGYTLKSVAFAIVSPSFAITLAMLGFMFYRKNKRTAIMQQMIIGERINSPLELTMSQLVLGIFAGALASLMLSYLGVMFGENSGIHIMFIFSVLLLFFNPRFICFSYSGALLGIFSIIMNIIKDPLSTIYPNIDMITKPFYIDIAALMTLVGVLHIVEGLLVLIDGDRGALPIFTNKEGKIMGGFALKRYWAIPIAILLIFNNGSVIGGESITAPSWWPIVKGPLTLDILSIAIIGIMPFYGVIGYNGVTFSKSKKEKSTSSGIGILLYGVILTVLAQLANKGFAWQLFVILFAPLGHEVMLNVQKLIESKSEPKFISDEEGLVVLEVAPDSPAHKVGIRSGDKLLEINDYRIENEATFYSFVNKSITDMKVKLKDSKGTIKELMLNKIEGKRIGLVLVPRFMPKEDVITNISNGGFSEILNNLKKHEDENYKEDESHKNEENDKDEEK